MGNFINNLPLVSVLITTRNRVAIIDKFLQRIFTQTYPKVEILVADDASSDGTYEYLHTKYPQIRLFRFNENVGLVKARNLLMSKARGEYLINIDDDAYFLNSDAITKLVKRMEVEPEIAIITFQVLKREEELLSYSGHSYYTNVFRGGASCFRKKIINEIGLFKDIFFIMGEETDYALRVLNKGYRILFYPDVKIVHFHSTLGRNLEKCALYSARNALLISWFNDSFPWYLILTIESIIKFLLGGVRNRVLKYVLRGFWKAIKDYKNFRFLRSPVSFKARFLYVYLRRVKITNINELISVYNTSGRYFMYIIKYLLTPK
ncbi:MAG: glycosyltransferase [candidate division WOR-3 bacterium]